MRTGALFRQQPARGVVDFVHPQPQAGGMVTRFCVTMCPDWRMVTQHRVTMPPGN